MKEKAINGSIKKIALVAIFLIFLVGTVSAAPVLSVDSVSADYYYSTYISANEDNLIKVVVSNSGPDPASDVTIDLSVTGAASNPIVDDFPIGDIAAGSSATVILNDTTLRNTQGYTVTYTAEASCSNGTSAQQDSAAINVRYNGYKGKRYWNGSSDITTQHTYLGNFGMDYYNQTEEKYATTSWSTRSEVWTTSDLNDVPANADIEAAWLYISYNWGSNSGIPDFTAQFNNNTLTFTTHYTDQSNLGAYGSKKYGLLPVNVTQYYNSSIDNYLNMTRNSDNMALYPSALVVVFDDNTYSQIIINEGCDELLVSNETKKYGTTMEEATAYAPFSVNPGRVRSADLYSFVASAGTQVDPSHIGDEGNLFFNDAQVGTYAWSGTARSAYPYIVDVKSNLSSSSEAEIQGTSTSGMLALQQILVVEY
jgi:hypothetical protein